jgi:hypothetical protein
VNGDSSDVYLDDGNFFSNEALLTSMDVNRRNRDLMFILGAGVYIMQIIDAAVDAHMFYFNVSDDLSLNYRPFFNYDPRSGRSSSGHWTSWSTQSPSPTRTSWAVSSSAPRGRALPWPTMSRPTRSSPWPVRLVR